MVEALLRLPSLMIMRGSGGGDVRMKSTYDVFDGLDCGIASHGLRHRSSLPCNGSKLDFESLTTLLYSSLEFKIYFEIKISF